jgi:outer membrane protein TolC
MSALYPLLAVAAAAQIQVPARGTMTLREAIDRALAASAGLQQAQAQERAAEAGVRAARAERLPLLELQAGYTRQSDVPEFFVVQPSGDRLAVFPNIPDNYRTRAAVAMPVYTGGRLGAQQQAAEAERAGAGHDVRTVTNDVALETASAYWSLVTALQSERVLADAVRSYEAHLTDAENRERLGLAARNEVLQVQVERDRAQLSALRARNAADSARANLARLLGLDDGRGIDPAESLDRPARPSRPVEAMVQEALGARPERTAAMARIGGAEARVRVERSARLPQASVGAGFDYANPNRRILPPEAVWQDSWDVNVNLTWKPFDGGRASAAVARAPAQLEAARSQLVEIDRHVRLQVTQRALDLDTSRAAAEVAERGLEAARENQRVASERYRAGVLSSADLLDAEVALLRAGLDRTDTQAQARLAEAALDRALGKLAPEPAAPAAP